MASKSGLVCVGASYEGWVQTLRTTPRPILNAFSKRRTTKELSQTSCLHREWTE